MEEKYPGKIYECKHCGAKMKKTLFPIDHDLNVPYLYVCFNDECDYYIRGWEHMKKNYNVNVSYRYRIDPFNDIDGPLPVYSKFTFKPQIAEEDLDEQMLKGMET